MLLDNVKLAMGISASAFDTELDMLINACKEELRLAGVVSPEDAPLFVQANIFYCKAYFRNDDRSERYQKAYEKVRDAMSLSGEYNEQ